MVIGCPSGRHVRIYGARGRYRPPWSVTTSLLGLQEFQEVGLLCSDTGHLAWDTGQPPNPGGCEEGSAPAGIPAQDTDADKSW